MGMPRSPPRKGLLFVPCSLGLPQISKPGCPSLQWERHSQLLGILYRLQALGQGVTCSAPSKSIKRHAIRNLTA